MVLVASGPYGSGAASGSIGSTTYSHNRYGQYVRQRSTPVNTNTAHQQLVRASMAQLTDRWGQILTAAQRTAWEVYASNVVVKNKLGEDVLLTGFNHYLRCNIPRMQIAATIIDAGPVVFEIPNQDPTFAITASEGTQLISVTFDNTLAWANELAGHLIKYQGLPANPQRNFFGGPWRLMGSIDGDAVTAPTSPDDEAAVFPIAALQRLWVYGRISRADGRLSEPFRADCFCAA